MFGSILRKLGLGGSKKTVQTVRLEVIAEQVKKFNEEKTQLDNKVHCLEDRTDELDQTVHETLKLTRDNQDRLNSIEESIARVIELSESIITQKEDANPPEEDLGESGEDGQEESNI